MVFEAVCCCECLIIKNVENYFSVLIACFSVGVNFSLSVTAGLSACACVNCVGVRHLWYFLFIIRWVK